MTNSIIFFSYAFLKNLGSLPYVMNINSLFICLLLTYMSFYTLCRVIWDHILSVLSMRLSEHQSDDIYNEKMYSKTWVTNFSDQKSAIFWDTNPQKSKTKGILFSTETPTDSPVPVSLNGNPLPWVSKLKHLGTTFINNTDGCQLDMKVKTATLCAKNSILPTHSPSSRLTVFTTLILLGLSCGSLEAGRWRSWRPPTTSPSRSCTTSPGPLTGTWWRHWQGYPTSGEHLSPDI